MNGPPQTLLISRRASNLKPSVTIAVANRAKAMKRDGLDVLSFTLGEPDFDTPERIKQAAIDALRAGQTKYMPTLGDPQTRAVIAEKLTRENSIPGLTSDHVAIAAGAKHIIYGVFQSLIDPPEPGQDPAEVLIPTPGWVSYAPIAQLAGAKIVEIPTSPADGFRLDPKQLAKAITPHSRVLILNSPSNPCSTMYTPDALRAIASVVADAASSIAPDLLILTDEIYEKIVYGDIEHFSIGSIPAIAERTITLNGLSKAYAMTGWRAGYCAIPGDFGEKLIKGIATLQGQMTTCITSFVYPAIRVALTECADEVERMRQAFAERAVIITDRLASIPGVSCPTPQGAFYAFTDVSSHFGSVTPSGLRIDSALSFCEGLLADQLMAVIPGEDFGGCGGDHIRISFACSADQINAGMDRLAAFIASLTRA